MERTVKVTVAVQVQGALANIARLRQGVSDFSTDLQKAANDRKATFQDIGIGLSALGVAIGGVSAFAIKKFADFDQAMSYVSAVTRETAGNMDLLREAALLAGARTVFTAIEAANAIEELAKAGVSTSDILSGGLTASLNLAASSGLGVARSAEIAAGALGMFKLAGEDLPEVADMLSSAANKSIGDVDDLAYGLRQVGPVAYQTGLSIKETVAALAAFAATGRIGQDAGTSFKRMLQLLTPVSNAAQEEMKKLGLDAYDAQGSFIGLSEFAGQLQEKLGGLTDEQRNYSLSVIYGSDAVAAATEIMNLGAAGINRWEKAVSEAGYATDNASLRLGNLKGDLEQLNGSVDTVMVTMGEAANGPLRMVVQGLTAMVNALGETDDEFQQFMFWAVTIAGGAALIGGAFFLAVPKVAAFTQGIGLLTAAFPKLGAAVGIAMKATIWLAAIGAVFTALTTWSEMAQNSLKLTGAEMKNVVSTTADGANIIKNAFSGLDGMTWDLEVGKIGDDVAVVQEKFVSLEDEIASFGGTIDKLDKYNERGWGTWDPDMDKRIDRLKDLGSTFAEMADSDLPGAQKAFKMMQDDMGLTDRQMIKLIDLMPQFKDKLTELATTAGLDASDGMVLLNLAMGEGADAAFATSIQLGSVSAAAEDSTDKISELAQQISDFAKGQFDVRDGIRNTAQAFRDLATEIDAAREAGATEAEMLDLTSEAGYKVTGAMDEVASSINNTASMMFAQGASIEEITGYLDSQRQAYLDMLTPIFGSTEAAQAYIDTLIATPEDISTQVNLNGIETAENTLKTFIQRWDGQSVQINVKSPAFIYSASGGAAGHATGGTVRGPGSGTSDSVPIWASAGEEVINARQAALWRPWLKEINAGAQPPRLAGGGTVDRVYAAPSHSAPSMSAAPTQSGDILHFTAPVIPDPRQPVADQLFTAARRLQVRLKARRG